MKDAMLILNPKSGSEKAEEIQKYLTNELNTKFDSVDVRVTERAGHATELAKEASEKKIDTICVFGGDGTVNEVLQAFVELETHPKLAIIPGGTGNLLTKVLGISQDPKEAMSSYDFKNTRVIDLGMANGQCFSLYLSIGAIPEAIHEVSTDEKTKFGFFAYLANSAKKLSKAEELHLKIQGDNGAYEGPVDHLIVSMTSKLGTFKFTQNDIELDDGLVHIFIIKNKGILDRLNLAGNAITGEIENSDNVEYMQSSKVTIESLESKKVVTDIDGEEGPSLPISIEILAKKLEIYIPKGQ